MIAAFKGKRKCSIDIYKNSKPYIHSLLVDFSTVDFIFKKFANHPQPLINPLFTFVDEVNNPVDEAFSLVDEAQSVMVEVKGLIAQAKSLIDEANNVVDEAKSLVLNIKTNNIRLFA
jgi:hypothetical protein